MNILSAIDTLLQRLVGSADEPIFVVVELALIGLAINWIIGKLEGTRGTRPLRRLLVMLVVVTLVVRILTVNYGWERLGVLYLFFVVAIGFITLVAFQPELRRAFIRVGDIRRLRQQTSHAKLINALVKAAGDLSRKKHGAVIAIRRNVDLKAWAENGTMINSDVSAGLISTIFFPNSPLHDLGVIVQDGKILAANCQFPSAESDEIDSSLGSRHLAAVGMSYESDALILVVSEETGTISLADNGKLTRYLSLDDLEQELERRLAGKGPVEKASHRKKGMLSRGWYLFRRLLVVLPLTVMVWYLADQATQVDRDNIKIVLKPQAPRGRVVTIDSPTPAEFTVKMRGPNREFEKLLRDAQDNVVEIAWPVADDWPVGVSPRTSATVIEGLSQISKLGLSVRDVKPDQMTVRVDELVVARDVPIRVNSGKALVTDVRVTDGENVIETATVTLPKHLLESFDGQPLVVNASVSDSIGTAKAGEVRTFGGVKLRLAGIADGDVTIEPAAVSVRLKKESETKEVVIPNVRVWLNLSSGLLRRLELAGQRVERVEPEEFLIENLKVRIETGDADLLDEREVIIVVSITEDDELPLGEDRTFDVKLLAPEGVSLVDPKPTVRVRVVKNSPGND